MKNGVTSVTPFWVSPVRKARPALEGARIVPCIMGAESPFFTHRNG